MKGDVTRGNLDHSVVVMDGDGKRLVDSVCFRVSENVGNELRGEKKRERAKQRWFPSWCQSQRTSRGLVF